MTKMCQQMDRTGSTKVYPTVSEGIAIAREGNRIVCKGLGRMMAFGEVDFRAVFAMRVLTRTIQHHDPETRVYGCRDIQLSNPPPRSSLVKNSSQSAVPHWVGTPI